MPRLILNAREYALRQTALYRPANDCDLRAPAYQNDNPWHPLGAA